MIGGGHGDRYSVGLNEGRDTIDDRGGGGTDTLILYTGPLANNFNYDWFKVDGNDLLVQVPRGSNGSLAIDIRIKNMGSSAGGIETVEIWGGQGNGPTAGAWNLTALWEEKTRNSTPPPPDPTDPDELPEPDEPPPSLFTWIGTSAANTFNGTSGEDVVAGLGGDDDLSGLGNDDTIMGNSGEDTLNGGTGDDLLIDDDPGSLFADKLIGGSGNDTLVFYGAPSGDTDTGDGGPGRDMAYIDLRSSTREWDLTEDDGDIWIRLDSGNSRGDIELENFEVIAVFFGSDDDFAHSGDSQQAYFEGGGGDDQLISEDKNDYLDGGSGDDKLDAGTGVDWIDGGSGNDRAEVDLSDESRDLTYVADYAEDNDGFTFENGTHIRDIERIELVTGSGDDRIWLGDDDDDVTTGRGDDAIYTDLEAHDSVDGGSGWDRLVVDARDSGERLRSSYDSSDDDFEISLEDLYASAEHRLHASSIEELVLLGGSADDTLRGGDGNDELFGGQGEDSLRGGDGDDWMEGGADDDDIHLGNGADWADGGSGTDTGYLDKSDSDLDFVFDARFAATSSGQTLADGTHVRNIERWNIDFGSGDDTVTTYVLGRRDIDLRSGDNTIIIDHRGQSSVLFAMPGSIINLPSYLVSVATDYETATDNIWVRGADHVRVYGGQAADTISGLGGSDILDGGLGADLMRGGAGNDTYMMDEAGDQVIEATGEGADIIYSAVSYSLTDTSEVESLSTLSWQATDAINLVGNYLNNALMGNAGANHLNGALGADVMIGREGNDSYIVDDAGDVIVEAAGQGIDSLFSSVSYRLGANADVEILSTINWQATNGIALTGNGLANTLHGNAGSNQLDGGGGNDIMYGREGNDIYFIDSFGDQMIEYAGQGIDTIYTPFSYALGDGWEIESLAALDWAGTDPINLTGNAVANVLIGNAGANQLNGAGGGDMMVGREGNDIYHRRQCGRPGRRICRPGHRHRLYLGQLHAGRHVRGREPVDRQLGGDRRDQPHRQLPRQHTDRQCRQQPARRPRRRRRDGRPRRRRHLSRRRCRRRRSSRRRAAAMT